MNWIKEAECRGMDASVFFVEHGRSDLSRKAIQICQACSVRSECLEYALDNGERFGVWGGMSVRQRERLRDERRAELWP